MENVQLCACVCVCELARCGEKERGRVCGMCGVEGNKDVYEILGLPQRASNSHNHVQYYYRTAIFLPNYHGYISTLQGLLDDTLLL